MIRIKSYVSYVGFPDKVFDAESFSNIDFSGIDFHRYLFEGFDMTRCSLRFFKGRGVMFRDSTLINADLTSANLCVSRLINCVFDGAVFVNACLQAARIRNCSFLNADFTNANLKGTNLSEAKLDGAIFTGARYSKSTTWPAGFLPEEQGAILCPD